jgi:hypothetical protein
MRMVRGGSAHEIDIDFFFRSAAATDAEIP